MAGIRLSSVTGPVQCCNVIYHFLAWFCQRPVGPSLVCCDSSGSNPYCQSRHALLGFETTIGNAASEKRGMFGIPNFITELNSIQCNMIDKVFGQIWTVVLTM